MSIPLHLFPHLFGTLALSALLFWLVLTAPCGRQLYAALMFLAGNVCCFLLSFVMHQQAAVHGTVSKRLLRLDYLGIFVHIWCSSTSVIYGSDTALWTRSRPISIVHALVTVAVAVSVCRCDFVLRKRSRIKLLAAYGAFALVTALFPYEPYRSPLCVPFAMMVGLNSLGGLLYSIDPDDHDYRAGSRCMHVLSLLGSLLYAYKSASLVYNSPLIPTF
jgi:predicted membrane channel-forming protein YqfA (hemolysin III family)